MVEQAEAFLQHAKARRLPCKILMHDNDQKSFKAYIELSGLHRNFVFAQGTWLLVSAILLGPCRMS